MEWIKSVFDDLYVRLQHWTHHHGDDQHHVEEGKLEDHQKRVREDLANNTDDDDDDALQVVAKPDLGVPEEEEDEDEEEIDDAQEHDHEQKVVIGNSVSGLIDQKDKKSGYLTTLTKQQEKELVKLRQLAETCSEAQEYHNHPDGDRMLLRFLRATMSHKNTKRVFHAEPALHRLEKALKWRREHGLNKPFEELEKPPKYELYQKIRPLMRWMDKRVGTTVVMERMGIMCSHIKKSHMTIPEIEMCLGYDNELLWHELRQFETEPRGCVVVIDERGVSLGFIQRISLMGVFNSIGAEFYPESVDKVYIVGAPSIFSKLYALVKKLIDADTRSKINVTSTIPTEFLRDTFDPSQLPKEFGGDSDVFLPVASDAHAAFEKRFKMKIPK